MTKIIAVVALCMLLVACEKTKPVNKNDFDPASLTYFQDSRTDLCFAAVLSTRLSTGGSYAENVIVTNVPCNEKVLGIVIK